MTSIKNRVEKKNEARVYRSKESVDKCISHLVFGAGVTGLSCLRYLQSKGQQAKIYDDNLSDEKLTKINLISKNVLSYNQKDNIADVLENIDTLLLSPGVSHQHPLVVLARKNNIDIINDVELFARENTLPVVAVTGSNAKSTVVTLLALMAEEQGLKVSLAGNIGRPVLDSLLEDQTDIFVLELSSFQLEMIESLQISVACILNISPDHLDWHNSYADYSNAKQKIYQHAQHVVYNRDDSLTESQQGHHKSVMSFGLNTAKDKQFGLSTSHGKTFLCFGDEPIIAEEECKKNTEIDIQNALAAMAIAYAANISFESITTILKTFPGLEHRCEWVASHNNIDWINDSKGTNVGATQAALSSLGKSIAQEARKIDQAKVQVEGQAQASAQEKASIILIAGGDSKGGDLSLLLNTVKQKVKALLLIGQDAKLFQHVFEPFVPCKIFPSLKDSISYAANVAESGDTVLLSPACASIDMFNDYQERGSQFKSLVQSIVVRGGA